MQIKALVTLAFIALASFVDAKKPGKKHIMRMKHHYDAIAALRNDGAVKYSGLACESTPTTGQISNHGGGVMTGTINIYIIWYGSWTTAQKKILTTLATGFGNSSYFNVEKSYGTNGPVTFKAQVTDNYSRGKSLADSDLTTIVSNAITTLGLPADSNGIYFINTDSSVQETSGFCTQYCGFHTNAKISGKTIKYAFIGNPSQSSDCLAGCTPCNTGASPNGDAGVDAMASVFSHELVEAASDPLGTTWYDANGYENADKCAYTYGATSRLSSGAYYNMNIGGLNYLIQQNWKATGGCYKSA